MEPTTLLSAGHTWPDVVLRLIEAMMVIIPVALSWDHRRRHREAVLRSDLSVEQLRALAAPKPMPTPGVTAGLIVAVLLGIGMVAHLAREQALASVQQTYKSCNSNADCSYGEECISRTCTRRCTTHQEADAIESKPHSDQGVDLRSRGLPVNVLMSER